MILTTRRFSATDSSAVPTGFSAGVFSLFSENKVRFWAISGSKIPGIFTSGICLCTFYLILGAVNLVQSRTLLTRSRFERCAVAQHEPFERQGRIGIMNFHDQFLADPIGSVQTLRQGRSIGLHLLGKSCIVEFIISDKPLYALLQILGRVAPFPPFWAVYKGKFMISLSVHKDILENSNFKIQYYVYMFVYINSFL